MPVFIGDSFNTIKSCKTPKPLDKGVWKCNCCGVYQHRAHEKINSVYENGIYNFCSFQCLYASKYGWSKYSVLSRPNQYRPEKSSILYEKRETHETLEGYVVV